MKRNLFYCLVLTSILLSACAPSVTPEPPTPVPPTTEPTAAEPIATSAPAALQLTSDAFEHDGPIPSKYACGGEDVSPALTWSEPPAGTQSFALIMDDPDAGSTPFVHWVIFNIPASTRGLPEAVPTEDTLPDGSINGRTSRFSTGYMGPCPPGGVHHYRFHIYALDAMLDLESGTGKGDLLIAMEGHILAEGELIGTYTQ